MSRRTRIRIAALSIGLVCGVGAPSAIASVDSELAFHRGVVAFGDKRYDDARASFEKVLAEDSEDAAAIQYLGLIAQQQGDFDRAISYFDRALVLEPDNLDLQLDRGTVLLEAGRLDEARAAFAQVLEARPDDARANLFAGIADYRAGEYAQAIERLDRAKALDPSLAAHATYYAGLSAAFLGNFAAAEGAFSEVEEQSPLSPMARSAESMRQQMTPQKVAEKRRWSLSVTAGAEWDSNPTFAGKSDPTRLPGEPDFGKQIDDFLGVFRLRGSYLLVDGETFSLTSGYEGYVSVHHKVHDVDLQTHVGYLSGTAKMDPIRFGLRYDYAYTMIDLTRKFRSLHRVTPSLTYRESDWGVTQLFFQWQNAEFLQNPPDPFDRDGNRYTVGLNQFIFLPQPVAYLRFGALGDVNRAHSSDFSYDGLEISAGAGVDLWFGIQFTTLYRFLYRNYRSVNALPADYVPPEFERRRSFIHRTTFEFARPITKHIEASMAASLDFTASNIDVYDYNRFVVGTYLSYRF